MTSTSEALATGLPCPLSGCGSSDAYAIYDDGHGHCFSCDMHVPHADSPGACRTRAQRPEGLIAHTPETLGKRRINVETCRKWGYGVGEFRGQTVQVADFHTPDGELCAQKVRFADKTFTILGDIKKAGLYGQHLWAGGGRKIVVTEGEIDALTVSQMQDNRWPVVSVPNGAQSARKACLKAIDYLESFDEVVFMFDMDEPGQEAALECAMLLTPGKAKIATLGMKDPSDLMQAGRGAEIVQAMWNAREYRPDGILADEDVWAEIVKEDTCRSVSYPWDGLQLKTGGMRTGELVVLCSGTGIGKSAVCRELSYHLRMAGEKVGILALEESVRRSAEGILGIHLSVPVHLRRGLVPVEELRAAYEATIAGHMMVFYDHWGSQDPDQLFAKVRFMAKGDGVSWIILDHISIVVSGSDSDTDERRDLDRLMTNLRALAEETGVGIIAVSHLKRPPGKAHEEGGQTSLSQLRGSHAIGQLSDMVIGLERDQQDTENPDVTDVRVLKNRWSGDTGLACSLRYDRTTGRLTETDFDEFTGAAGAEPEF